MIHKINKTKRLGLVFSDYTWDMQLLPFKQVNLLYGWNGSGKTTLSRLFGAIGGASIKELEYEIEDDQGAKFRQGVAFPLKIRVFNQEYIQNNVRILEGRPNSISVLLGKENKDLVDTIEADKKLLYGDPVNTTKPGSIFTRSEKTKEKERKSAERDSSFTEIAKTIGQAIGGNALRGYRKPEAEKDFAILTAKAELSPDDLERYSIAAKQESLPTVGLLTMSMKLEDTELEMAAFLNTNVAAAVKLLSETATSEMITRLASNADLSQWVEQGFALHQKHSSDTCEYCLQKLPAERLAQLARHFSDADKQLKGKLEDVAKALEEVHRVVLSLTIPDRMLLYSELRATFDAKASVWQSSKDQLLSSITECVTEIRNKKTKTIEPVKLGMRPDMKPFAQCVGEMNTIIAGHNKTTTDFDTVKKEAAKRLKSHYLSTIFDKTKACETQVNQLASDIKGLDTDISAIQERIIENMAKISSKHRACEVINEKLTTFLGHKELTFVPQMQKEKNEEGIVQEIVVGYQIMRGINPAVHLSEGEKTAIAFVYFVVHLGDQDFKVSDGIVVIDDPISSLDSNSLYQAFSFLKNVVKDGKQVFILTHNFDFLQLLLNWRNRNNNTGYYMIKNTFANDVRSAFICKMDKELCDYGSEYHYLFKTLKQIQVEQDDTIARAYPVPNLARKVWESFLLFAVPSGKGPYSQMTDLKQRGFDEQKLDAIYKFTNDQSHITGAGFNPSLVPEAKKVIAELFEMMEKIAPDHYNTLNKATA